MKLAIDFDSTLVKRKGIPSNGNPWLEKPLVGARESINLFLEKGYDLYICTNREHYEWPKIKEWLIKNKFPEMRITNKKELGTTVYIDDRALRFTSWQDIRKYFT